MGANTINVKISQNLQYIGQVLDHVPHGKGIITKYSNQQNKKQIYWVINGEFFKGQLINCFAKKKQIEYEGSVKCSTFNGFGKFINKKSNTTFLGEFINGTIVKGQLNIQRKYYCKGQFKQVQESDKKSSSTKQSNNVKTYALQGSTIQFKWIQNKEILLGNFINGEVEEEGTYTFYNGDIYKGNFKNGLFNGYGFYTSQFSPLISITGNFYNSLPHSNSKNRQKHTIKFANGDTYYGQIKNGQMHDRQGIYTYKDGTIYKGSVIHNKLSGNCQIRYPNQSPLQKYKGQVSEGKFNGLGVIQYKNGIIFKGYFFKNCKNGPCIFIYGQKIYKCLYMLDELIEELTEIQNHLK